MEQKEQSPEGAQGVAFDLADPLIWFETDLLDEAAREPQFDLWTIGDACEGVQIFGTTGSGKTSGSGQTIARAFLRNDFGGLILCAKIDERELWERYARETKREDDLVIFAPDQPHRFNFLDYEYGRQDAGGGITENVTRLFQRAMEMMEGGRSAGAGNDPYWQRAAMQMLRNAVDMLRTLDDLRQIEGPRCPIALLAARLS